VNGGSGQLTRKRCRDLVRRQCRTETQGSAACRLLCPFWFVEVPRRQSSDAPLRRSVRLKGGRKGRRSSSPQAAALCEWKRTVETSCSFSCSNANAFCRHLKPHERLSSFKSCISSSRRNGYTGTCIDWSSVGSPDSSLSLELESGSNVESFSRCRSRLGTSLLRH
jgi:hypothetical protein